MSSRTDQSEENPYTQDEERGWAPFYPSFGWGGAWGVWPFGARSEGEEEPRRDTAGYEGAGDSTHDEDGNGSLWDEGLITLLIVAGVILFVFPEPATSAVGIVLLAVGVIAWLVDWAM